MIDRTQMTIRGHVLTVPAKSLQDLVFFAVDNNLKQFTVCEENGWTLSTPLNARQQVAYAWLYHKMKGLHPEPPKGGGKPPKGPTPPTGGTPGAGRQEEEPELLMAVA